MRRATRRSRACSAGEHPAVFGPVEAVRRVAHQRRRQRDRRPVAAHDHHRRGDRVHLRSAAARGHPLRGAASRAARPSAARTCDRALWRAAVRSASRTRSHRRRRAPRSRTWSPRSAPTRSGRRVPTECAADALAGMSVLLARGATTAHASAVSVERMLMLISSARRLARGVEATAAQLDAYRRRRAGGAIGPRRRRWRPTTRTARRGASPAPEEPPCGPGVGAGAGTGGLSGAGGVNGCVSAAVGLACEARAALHAEVRPRAAQPEAGRQFGPAHRARAARAEHLGADDPRRDAAREHLDATEGSLDEDRAGERRRRRS